MQANTESNDSEHSLVTLTADDIALSKQPNTEQLQQLKQLDSLMTKEKLYLKPNLTQQDLASALALTRHQLSELLSLHQAGNFYELLNGYRIDAVIEEMQVRPANCHCL